MLALFEEGAGGEAGWLLKTFGKIMNWGRWSEIVEVKLPVIAYVEIILENILSISVLEWEVSRAGCKIYGTKELEARESINLLVGLWLL